LILGAKKRKTTLPTTRHITSMLTTNETSPLSNSVSQDIEYPSPELVLPEESNLLVTNDIPIESSNDEINCPIIADNNDDDDIMPVVASVEEEQPIEDSTQSEIDTTFIVESTDCNDERIQLNDTIPSCSSGYESSAIITNIDNNIHEDKNDETNSIIRSREHSSSCLSTITPNSPKILSINKKKVNKKRQRNKYGKSRARSRSLTPRNLKKQRPIDDDDDDESLVIIITNDKIEQHLRTLFMVSNEPRRTRTRPVKTPTRLVEEINGNNNNNNSMKIIEPDANVFDILSSSTTTDTISNNESTENPHQPCTYNVIISNKPNKLGLTIKKVAQP